MLSLESAYGTMDEDSVTPPSTMPPRHRGVDVPGQRPGPRPNMDPRPEPRPEPRPTMGPGPDMGYGRPRRQVRFVNDSVDPKYARVDTTDLSKPNFFEKNKLLVGVIFVAVLVVLIVVFVVVLRNKSSRTSPMTPIPVVGGGIPAYVGGQGWESASNFNPRSHYGN